jgi:hypothetical protein
MRSGQQAIARSIFDHGLLRSTIYTHGEHNAYFVPPSRLLSSRAAVVPLGNDFASQRQI